MEQELSTSEPIVQKMYSFESESQLFKIPVGSDQGMEYRSLPSADAKMAYLKEHGKETTKELEGRIMIPQKGAWVYRNVGQIEYLIPAESELGEQYVALKDPEDKKAFMEKNVTMIREWPVRIVRHQHV